MYKVLTVLVTTFISGFVFSNDLPDFQVKDLEYEGAMRLSGNTFGGSRLGFANGVMAVNGPSNTVFIVGHTHHQMIAEFPIQAFTITDSLSNITNIVEPIQPFSPIISKVKDDNPGKVDWITGLSIINNKLLVNVGTYYDGNGSNNDTTIVVDDLSNLKNTKATGFIKLAAKHHAAGWGTPIPPNFIDILGGDYLLGYASNLPINLRSSMGPSAFVIDSSELINSATDDTVHTTPVLDYSISHPIVEDLKNESKSNSLWTELATAQVGFIAPGTDTYAVFGTMGGAKSGVGYKLSSRCGGWCPYDSSDWANYYWLFHVQDFVEVLEHRKEPWEIQPYEYGRIELQHEDDNNDGIPSVMIGASYDHRNARLYFLLGTADKLQSQYEAAPVLLSYSWKVNNPKPPEKTKPK